MLIHNVLCSHITRNTNNSQQVLIHNVLWCSHSVCEYEEIGWLMKKLLEENETLTQMTPPALLATHPPGFTNL